MLEFLGTVTLHPCAGQQTHVVPGESGGGAAGDLRASGTSRKNAKDAFCVSVPGSAGIAHSRSAGKMSAAPPRHLATPVGAPASRLLNRERRFLRSAGRGHGRSPPQPAAGRRWARGRGAPLRQARVQMEFPGRRPPAVRRRGGVGRALRRSRKAGD